MISKPYPYTLTELIQHDDFIAWVLHPNETNEARWSTFMRDFPQKKLTVKQARDYVILLAEDTGRTPPSSKQRDKMWGAVEEFMHQGQE